MNRQLDHFSKKIPEHLRKLQVAAESNDIEKAGITAHSMKPLLTVLGITQGLEIAEVIERHYKSGIVYQNLSADIQKLSEICENALQEVMLIDPEQ